MLLFGREKRLELDVGAGRALRSRSVRGVSRGRRCGSCFGRLQPQPSLQRRTEGGSDTAEAAAGVLFSRARGDAIAQGCAISVLGLRARHKVVRLVGRHRATLDAVAARAFAAFGRAASISARPEARLAHRSPLDACTTHSLTGPRCLLDRSDGTAGPYGTTVRADASVLQLMPNVVGLHPEDALSVLRLQGLQPELIGDGGQIIAQQPAQDEAVENDDLRRVSPLPRRPIGIAPRALPAANNRSDLTADAVGTREGCKTALRLLSGSGRRFG